MMMIRQVADRVVQCVRGMAHNVDPAGLAAPVREIILTFGIHAARLPEGTSLVDVIQEINHGTRPSVWRQRLERSPIQCHHLAMGSLEAVIALQTGVSNRNDITLPWMTEALGLRPLLEQLQVERTAQTERRSERAKAASKPPANQKVDVQTLLEALRVTCGNRSAAGKIVGLSEQTVTTRINRTENQADHPLHEFFRPMRVRFSAQQKAEALDRTQGDCEAAADQLGIRSHSKIMDSVWSADEDSPLRRHWRPKKKTGRPPLVEELRAAQALSQHPTEAAAAKELNISESALNRQRRTAQTSELRTLKRKEGDPHPGEKVPVDQLITSLESCQWNYGKTARHLEGRVTSSAIEGRVKRSNEGSKLWLAREKWLDRLAGKIEK